MNPYGEGVRYAAMSPSPTLRTFAVHELDKAPARLIHESSIEAAAAAFAEDVAPTDAHQLSVVVQEVDTGREHCFRVDLDTGDTVPCG